MRCTIDGCENVRSTRSKKYCVSCAKIAREKFREMIIAQGIEKEEKILGHQHLLEKAIAAGIAAGTEKVPTPMIVEQHSNMWDDNSPVEKSYYVPQGVCGFAWVNVRPGNSSFARWAVKEGLARKSYSGGIDFWISDYGQSYEKKSAHAAAMAKVLEDAGLKAYAMSRMD